MHTTLMSFNRRMNKEIVVHIHNGWTQSLSNRKASQKKKNKHHTIFLISETQKNDTDELICKAEID